MIESKASPVSRSLGAVLSASVNRVAKGSRISSSRSSSPEYACPSAAMKLPGTSSSASSPSVIRRARRGRVTPPEEPGAGLLKPPLARAGDGELLSSERRATCGAPATARAARRTSRFSTRACSSSTRSLSWDRFARLMAAEATRNDDLLRVGGGRCLAGELSRLLYCEPPWVEALREVMPRRLARRSSRSCAVEPRRCVFGDAPSDAMRLTGKGDWPGEAEMVLPRRGRIVVGETSYVDGAEGIGLGPAAGAWPLLLRRAGIMEEASRPPEEGSIPTPAPPAEGGSWIGCGGLSGVCAMRSSRVAPSMVARGGGRAVRRAGPWTCGPGNVGRTTERPTEAARSETEDAASPQTDTCPNLHPQGHTHVEPAVGFPPHVN